MVWLCGKGDIEENCPISLFPQKGRKTRGFGRER